jgi:hypothetical protein
MIGLILFLVFAVPALGLIVINFISDSIKHTTKLNFMKTMFFCIIAAASVFVLCSVLPYLLQQRDEAFILSSQSNITLYDQYTDEYTKAAQDQIAQYQQMVSEMAKTATSTQLQFYNQQIDAVGNELSAKIKTFKDLKMAQQIEINLHQAAIDTRLKNKWFFWIK